MKPRRSFGKSGIFGSVPLHRSSGIVPSFSINAVDQFFFWSTLFNFFKIHVSALNVIDFRNVFNLAVRHPKLFALINVRRSLQQMQDDCQHFGAFYAINPVISILGNCSWQIMVVPKKTVPSFIFKTRLPLGQNMLKS